MIAAAHELTEKPMTLIYISNACPKKNRNGLCQHSGSSDIDFRWISFAPLMWAQETYISRRGGLPWQRRLKEKAASSCPNGRQPAEKTTRFEGNTPKASYWATQPAWEGIVFSAVMTLYVFCLAELSCFWWISFGRYRPKLLRGNMFNKVLAIPRLVDTSSKGDGSSRPSWFASFLTGPIAIPKDGKLNQSLSIPSIITMYIYIYINSFLLGLISKNYFHGDVTDVRLVPLDHKRQVNFADSSCSFRAHWPPSSRGWQWWKRGNGCALAALAMAKGAWVGKLEIIRCSFLHVVMERLGGSWHFLTNVKMGRKLTKRH